MNMSAAKVLLLPGWLNSDADHWQSRWEAMYGYQRLEQHDWQRPLRGDWSMRLHETLLDSPEPMILVAHSLGCVLTAWWAASAGALAASKVQGALLVAPADIEQPELRQQLPGWAPIALQPLPFPSIVVASRNDPYCAPERSQAMAQAWGAQWVDAGLSGHLNSSSGLGAWPEGQALMQRLKKD